MIKYEEAKEKVDEFLDRADREDWHGLMYELGSGFNRVDQGLVNRFFFEALVQMRSRIVELEEKVKEA